MRRILMLATGGTIASRKSGQGLSPAITSEEILSFENYGVESIHIDEMYVGFATEKSAQEGRIPLGKLELTGWGKTVTSHERLKESYYMLKEYWTGA